MLHKSASSPHQWKGRATAPRESHAWRIRVAFSYQRNLTANQAVSPDKNSNCDQPLCHSERSEESQIICSQHRSDSQRCFASLNMTAKKKLGSIRIIRGIRASSDSLLRHVQPQV